MQAEELETAVRAGRVDLLLAATRREGSVSRRRFYASALSRAIRWADPGAIDDAELSAAADLGVDARVLELHHAEPPPHAVHVPLVFDSSLRGFVRLLFVSFDTGMGGLELEPSARQAVASALRLAATRARLSEPRPHVLSAAQPAAFESIEIHGSSLGAGCFVSAFSLWSGRAVRPGSVITGALSESGEVLPVAQLVPKLDGVLQACASARRLLVPAADEEAVRAGLARGDRPLEVVGVRDLDELIEASLMPSATPWEDADVRLFELRRSFDRGWSRYRWPAIRERLDRLAGQLPATRPDLAVPVYTMLGGVSRHLGDPQQSLRLLMTASAVARPDDAFCVPDAALTFLHRHLSLTLRELGRFEDARQAAQEAVDIAERARLRGELVKGLGCAGLVAVGRGDPAEASRLHRRAVEVALGHDASEAPQSIGYLVDALGRQGDLKAARQAFEQGVCLDAEGSGRRTQRSWLYTIFAGALLRAGEAQEALTMLDEDEVREAMARAPMPGLLVRRFLGRALVQRDHVARGYEILAASPSAYGADALPQLRFRLHLNVLWEARLRAQRGALSDDARARALNALGHLPRAPEVIALLNSDAEEAGRALETGADPAPALERLLETCERLG
ncbi:MAG: hypothetical protein GXP55_01110 [Deltaproteobacteria bacterium]|nr:hypothetical protein [Deltaproteobacteria bacterium]